MTREELDARAEELNISTRSNWKDETVAEKIAEAEAALASGDDTPPGGDDAHVVAQGAAAEQSAPIVPPVLPAIRPAIQTRSVPVMITVTGPKKGRWRAGRHFTPAPLAIPLADLSDEEIAMLTDDPKLVVSGLPQD